MTATTYSICRRMFWLLVAICHAALTLVHPQAMTIVKGEAAVASVRALVEGNNLTVLPTYFTPNLIDDDAGKVALVVW